MKCKTVKQMQRIARAGAMKMPQQAYTCEEVDGPAYEVTNPEGKMYRVDLTVGEGGYCTCGFYRANAHLAPATCCKHTLWAAWSLEKAESAWWHALGRELARSGAGLGQPEISGNTLLPKMFPHQFF